PPRPAATLPGRYTVPRCYPSGKRTVQLIHQPASLPALPDRLAKGDPMTRKSTIAQSTNLDNGQVVPEEIQRPADTTDTSFDPANLELPSVAGAPTGPDPFDPESLRLSPGLNASL